MLFTWRGSKDNQLSIMKGEVVTVLQQSEKWWSGEVDGKVGGLFGLFGGSAGCWLPVLLVSLALGWLVPENICQDLGGG